MPIQDNDNRVQESDKSVQDEEIKTQQSFHNTDLRKDKSDITNISEIRGKPEKSIADYITIYKSLQQKQNQTMMFYKGFAAQKLDKLAKRIEKQENIESKIHQRENKAARLENKVARLADTNKMLSSFFADKKIPAIVGFFIERNENRIAKLQDKRIPKNNQKLQTMRNKSAKNHLKMEHMIAKVDKVQALSSVIRSFSVLNPTARREQFRTAMDDLHNASERAIQCKIDKCNMRIDKLYNTLPENPDPFNYSISNINAEDKITALTEKRDTLVRKQDKLKGLQKPFAELDDNKSDQLISDVEEQVDKTTETVKNEKNCVDMAEDIAVYAAEKANELQREDVSRGEVSKSSGKEHRKLPLSEQIDKARADNPRTDAPKQTRQQTKKQEQNL